MEIFEGFLLGLLSILYSWTIYNVPAFLAGLVSASSEKASPSLTVLPTFSIIVPVKNEELVIERLLERLLALDYPKEKVEVIIVEDGSEDRTCEICEGYMAKYPGSIRFLHRETSEGKPSALNFASSQAKGDIIGVLDADNVPERDILLRAASYFGEGDVAAIQGVTYSINRSQNLVARLAACEEATWLRVFVRGKSSLGLFVPLTGSCGFVRRPILERLGGWDDRSVAEDVELAVRLIAAGYKIRYAGDVCSLQESASSVLRLVKQRARWFRGYMETCLKYGKLLGKPFKLGFDAEVTLAGPYVLSLCAVSYVAGAYSFLLQGAVLPRVPSALASVGSMLTVGIFCFLGAVWVYQARPLKVKDIVLIPAIYLYWVLLSGVAFLTFMSFLFRRPRKWERTQKTGRIDAEPTG